jgi:hypothetical protein
VNAGATQLALERVGYNVADFRIPDERGWVAKNETIAADEEAELHTALPLDDILAELKTHTELLEISTDPGRYICNYVYFQSLHWLKQRPAEKTQVRNASKMDGFCLVFCCKTERMPPWETRSTSRSSSTCRSSRSFRRTSKSRSSASCSRFCPSCELFRSYPPCFDTT